jgi:hypothetical protein
MPKKELHKAGMIMEGLKMILNLGHSWLVVLRKLIKK